MKRKLRIWGMSNQDTAVYFYRIVQPLKFIAKQKRAVVHHLPIFGDHKMNLTTGEFREYQALEGKWADVLFSTCASDRHYLALLWALKEKYKLKLVIDIDDDILSTHTEPNSPAYKAYMQKDARHAEYAQACMREADLLVVSTEYLKKKYQSINPNIVVNKNTINLEDWKFPKKDDKTIGFSGSGSHQADWIMVESIVKKFKDKMKVKILGPVHAPIADEQETWVRFLRYPETLMNLGFSIGLAPLKDTLMARAKSNLRWLEYSAMGVPTIASDVVPFRDMENVILVKEPEEWEAAIKDLVDNPQKRTKLGEMAMMEMKDKYDPSYWSERLFEAIAKL